MILYNDIRKVHIELSTRCNAACPDCPRNFRGVDVLETYPKCELSLEDIQFIFDETFVKQLDQILINGNLGDFVTAKDGLKIVEYFRATNSRAHIEISTNGSAKPNIWEPLAKFGVQVDFRIDGLSGTHKLYRQNTDFDFIIENAVKYINAGGNASWLWIVFDHNRHQIEEGRTLAKQLGFREFRVIDHGRNTMPVFTPDKRLSHLIGDYRGDINFDNLLEQRMLYKIDPYGPVRTEKNSYTIDCYAKKHSEIYISANGEVYPCCWLGYYPFHSNSRPSNVQLVEIVKNNNALVHGLEQAIEYFSEIENSWTKNSVQDGKIYECNQTCGIK